MEREPSAQDLTEQSQTGEPGSPTKLIDLDWSFMEPPEEFEGVLVLEGVEPRPPTPAEMMVLLHFWLMCSGHVLAVSGLDRLTWSTVPADTWHKWWKI